jgi:uncharacterized membrane protein
MEKLPKIIEKYVFLFDGTAPLSSALFLVTFQFVLEDFLKFPRFFFVMLPMISLCYTAFSYSIHWGLLEKLVFVKILIFILLIAVVIIAYKNRDKIKQQMDAQGITRPPAAPAGPPVFVMPPPSAPAGPPVFVMPPGSNGTPQ